MEGASLSHEGALIPQTCGDSSPTNYAKGEKQRVEQLNCTENKEGWWKTPGKQLLEVMEIQLKRLHQETHTGADASLLLEKQTKSILWMQDAKFSRQSS